MSVLQELRLDTSSGPCFFAACTLDHRYLWSMIYFLICGIIVKLHLQARRERTKTDMRVLQQDVTFLF